MGEKYQAVVIGGGVVGCSVLYHLTKFGWTNVALFERKELTAGSTWHAAGGYHAINSDPNVARLQDYTVNLYKEIEDISGQDVGMHATGGVNFAATDARWEFLRTEWARHKVMGIRSELIGPDEVAALCPIVNVDGVKGGLFSPDEGYVDPYGVTHAYASAARKQGATIKRHTCVLELRRTANGDWNIITDKGDFLAEHIVNAGGLWAREVGAMVGHYPPLVPMEHHYLITDNLKSFEEQESETPLIVDLDGGIYLRQEHKGALLGVYETPAQTWSEDATPWDYGESELLPDNMDRISPALEFGFKRFPEVAETGIKKVVNGSFTFTPDGNPLVGPVEGVPNYWLACGVLAGFAQGGGIGLALSQWMINGEPDSDLFAMDNARFGDFATRAYTKAKACETYERRFDLAHPNEYWPAGRPSKQTPIYGEYKKRNAVFGASYGQEQALYFARSEDARIENPTFRRSNAFASVAEECRAAREAAGLLELSAYAKYVVEGPDATAWLNRIVASTLPRIGGVRLAPMLSPKGRIYGDLTIMRLREDKFILVGSGYLQAWHMRWFSENLPSSGVTVTNVTDTWHGFSVVGPNSREILQKLTSYDIGKDALKFMSVRELDVGFAPAIVARLSISGELGYEVYTPSQYAASLYEAFFVAGQNDGLENIGVYALLSLRLEKGYGIWSREYSPDYTPTACGLDKFINYDKPAFVGREAALVDRDTPAKRRLTLMQLETGDVDSNGYEPVFVGEHYVGFTTSGGYGHCIKKSLAMGYIDAEQQKSDAYSIILGERRGVKFLERAPYDPDGERLRS
ncbi:MAG: FAD-dependent oxidoreductase [Pseudomonadota bacterium]